VELAAQVLVLRGLRRGALHMIPAPPDGLELGEQGRVPAPDRDGGLVVGARRHASMVLRFRSMRTRV
jgi:hypothetical protein